MGFSSYAQSNPYNELKAQKLLYQWEHSNKGADKDLLRELSNLRTDARCAVPMLTQLAQDENKLLWPDAAVTLSKIDAGNNIALSALKKVLLAPVGSIDEATRRAATEALWNISHAGKTAVINALEQENHEARFAAIETIAFAYTVAANEANPKSPRFDIDEPRLATIMTRLLLDEDSTIQVDAGAALGYMGAGARWIVSTLIEILQQDNDRARYGALRALAEIGPSAQPAMPVLLKIFQQSVTGDQWSNDYGEIINAMAKIAPDDVTGLIEFATSNNDKLRYAAIHTLAQRGEVAHAAMPIILKIINSNNEDVQLRITAIEATGTLHANDEIVIATLMSIVKGDNTLLAFNAIKAMSEIGPDALKANADTILDSIQRSLQKRPELVESSFEVLGQLAQFSPRAMNMLIEFSHAKDEEIRIQAANVIPPIDFSHSSTAELITALQSDDSRVRISALIAMRSMELKDEEVARALIKIISNAQEIAFHRQSALIVLMKMGPSARGVLPDLQQLLKVDNDGLKLGAADAIIAISGDTTLVVETLIALMKKDEGLIGGIAMQFLMKRLPIPHAAIGGLNGIIHNNESNAELRQRAASLLLFTGPDGIKTLLADLQDEQEYINDPAAWALSMLISEPAKLATEGCDINKLDLPAIKSALDNYVSKMRASQNLAIVVNIERK